MIAKRAGTPFIPVGDGHGRDYQLRRNPNRVPGQTGVAAKIATQPVSTAQFHAVAPPALAARIHGSCSQPSLPVPAAAARLYVPNAHE